MTLQTNKAAVAERVLFYGSLALSVFMIFCSKYNPSLDGPIHLYNARIMNYLFSGNEFMHGFYSLNKVPIPNLTDHYLLALFNIFFSSAVSLKILLTICVAGLSLSFRAIIRLIAPENIGLSAFAIPVAHSFLFYIGFYNFCLSQFLMLWAIFYYLKHLYSLSIPVSARRYISILCLLLLIYFTNGLSFLLTGMVLLMLEVQLLLPLLKAKEYKALTKRFFLFASLWLPGLVCLLIFAVVVPTLDSNPPHSISFAEHLKWIYQIRPLMVYSGNELPYTIGFFVVLVSLSVCLFFKRIKGSSTSSLNKLPVFIFTTVIVFILFFIIPDSASVGMMSIRLCFYLFLFYSLWLFIQTHSRVLIWGSVILIYSLQWGLFFGKHYPALQSMDTRASEIAEAGKYIKPNSIVLPVECTGNWIMTHFTDYAALDKPMINPYNYEPNVRWFPVVWNYGTAHSYFGNQYDIDQTLWWGKPHLNTSFEIDYIFVLGDMNIVRTESDYTGLKANIENMCSLVYASADSSIHIYSVNHKPI